MGASDIIRTALQSQLVRSEILGDNETRIIRGSGGDGGGNIFASLGQWLFNLGGWLIKSAIGIVTVSVTTLYNYFVQALIFIDNFNWNTTDEELDKLLENQVNSLGGLLGGTLGNLVGWLSCGIIPSAAIFTFNEALGVYLLKEVGEEALDELVGNLSVIIRRSFEIAVSSLVFNAYKHTRKAIKAYFRDPNSAQSKFFQSFFGSNFNSIVKAWGEEGTPAWSFAKAKEEKIDSIKNPFLQNFVEEFVEEAQDACIEAGYVVAQGIDSWILQQKITEAQKAREQRVVEVQPNREVEHERFIVSGQVSELQSELTTTLTAYQLIENRDIGQWVGEPVREVPRQPVKQISMLIQLSSIRQPPFISSDGKKVKRVQISVPDINRAKVDWQLIKTACGGTTGYSWGRFRGNAKLSSGYSLNVYGGSAEEAENRVKALLELTNSELRGLTVTEEKREGARVTYSQNYKETTQVYPVYVTMLNQVKILNEEAGRASLSGVYKQRRFRLPLWTDTKPDEWDDAVLELFATPGPNG